MSDVAILRWQKSSRSNGSGGHCVEVAAIWRESSRSNGSGGECVEAAGTGHGVAVRDSKNPDAPHLTFDRHAFTAFTRAVKAGTHDL